MQLRAGINICPTNTDPFLYIIAGHAMITIAPGAVSLYTALHKWGGAHQTSNHLPKPNL